MQSIYSTFTFKMTNLIQVYTIVNILKEECKGNTFKILIDLYISWHFKIHGAEHYFRFET